MNDSIYVKVNNRSSYSTVTKTELWLPLGSRHCLEGAQRAFGGIEIVLILIPVVVTRVYAFVRIHQIVHLRSVHLPVLYV